MSGRDEEDRDLVARLRPDVYRKCVEVGLGVSCSLDGEDPSERDRRAALAEAAAFEVAASLLRDS